jgi:hypothetical protein
MGTHIIWHLLLPRMTVATVMLGAAASIAAPMEPSHPFGAEPYPVFWSVNGPNASAFAANGSVNVGQFGIKANNFTICGGMMGSIMPRLTETSHEPEITGGVPQAANVTLFLEGLAENIAARIPDAAYAGLAVYDFEAWAPLWTEDTGAGGWHSKAYRTYSIRLVQKSHPTWTAAQAEVQAIIEFETAAIQFFVAALQHGKQLRPNALWGFYGMPYVHPKSNASKLLPIWEASDVLYPSIYLSAAGTARQHVKDTVALSVEMAVDAVKTGQPRKPVYPFGWECCEILASLDCFDNATVDQYSVDACT